MFRQRVLHGDLIRNFRVNDSADRVAEGPGIEVEYWREFVLDTEVVNHNVWMAIRGEGLHELADSGEVTEPEAEGWLWLEGVSRIFLTGTDVSFTYQSIESASMLVESDEEVYTGDGKKGEHSSQDVACVELYHKLHRVGCFRCYLNAVARVQRTVPPLPNTSM